MSSSLASTSVTEDLSHALVAERPRLVRLCRQMTNSADVAEDLAQETLLEAWRLLDRLREPAGLSAWLNAIARNVCLRWLRAHGRERAHLAPVCIPDSESDTAEASPQETLAAEADDPLAQLERAEVGALLARALAALPETTRALTVASATLSTTELAQRFQLSEGAVRVRLHRGRQALRQALSGELRAEAEALDLALPATSDWIESRIWCPFCGVGRLRYRVNRETGEYNFYCARGCAGYGVAGSAINQSLVQQVSSPKSLLARHCLMLATTYREALAGENPRCDCGAPVRFTTWTPENAPNTVPYGINGICPNCGLVDGASAWHLALDTVEAQQFWRRHPRMRSLPVTAVERDNRPAIVTGFEAVGAGDRLVIVSDAKTYALLHVEASAAR